MADPCRGPAAPEPDGELWLSWIVGPERTDPFDRRIVRLPDRPDQAWLEHILGLLRADIAAGGGQAVGARHGCWVHWAIHATVAQLDNVRASELPGSGDLATFDAAVDVLVGRVGAAIVTADRAELTRRGLAARDHLPAARTGQLLATRTPDGADTGKWSVQRDGGAWPPRPTPPGS
jgi:hypothetical protein